MQFDKSLKLLICFVMIIPYLLVNGEASASSNYNHEELMQYKGYGEAMYDSIVEQTTFISGQYTDNKEYVRDSVNEIKDYANFWKNEYNDFTDSCYQTSMMNCLGEMVERGGAYVLTVGDWFKNLFNDYDESINGDVPEEDYNSPYASYFYSVSNGINVVDGYYYKFADYGKNKNLGYNVSAGVTSVTGGFAFAIQFLSGGGNLTGYNIKETFTTREAAESARLIAEQNRTNVSYVLSLASAYGYPITVFKEDNSAINPNREPVNRNISTINDYIQTNPNPEVVVPQLKPVLVCPDGSEVQMSINGSTFLDVAGKTMMVSKDGTAQINSQLCLLNWEKPIVQYNPDGEVEVIQPDGKLVKPENDKVEELDKSLIQYVKNAYEYATSTLKTAVDGLKSLAAGAKNLTNLFGTFFSWLPGEMVVLMSSGLGIAIGLRLFRR